MAISAVAIAANAPAVHTLQRRLEKGIPLSCFGASQAAQPFLIALVHHLFAHRPILAITEGLKSQERFFEDLKTWLCSDCSPAQSELKPPLALTPDHPSIPKDVPLLFYPAWEILAHESKLPHADVISERLETLVTLLSVDREKPSLPPTSGHAPVILASVSALLQLTFPTDRLHSSIRRLTRGESIDPLTLIEWLQKQGYQIEAQVTQKGEFASRGGIIDIFPPTSPWPVRLEFFGQELESLRYFDPLTQISRETIKQIILPPAGELGILKRSLSQDAESSPPFASLLDYLPSETIVVLCEPEHLAHAAEQYSSQIPASDPFFISWKQFQDQINAFAMGRLDLAELSPNATLTELPLADPLLSEEALAQTEETARSAFLFAVPDLENFRPLNERPPDRQIIETQRREFFQQLHRWIRQGYDLQIYCNNEGERQRFREIWKEYGLEHPLEPETGSPSIPQAPFPRLNVLIGNLGRGFLFEDAKLVVVTDAEIFGRYRAQSPRRLKSPHAQTMRSALEIDFAELTEGDYVVHLQHGVGRYLGLQRLPAGGGRRRHAAHSTEPQKGEECLVIEFAHSDPQQPPPKLYVPVTEAHLVSKYVGAGKARPPLNTLGGTRWAKAKAHAERAVRDLASELLSIQAAREAKAGHPFVPDTPWQREFESAFIYEETPDQDRAILETKRDMETSRPMDRLICGDVGFGKTEVAIRAAFKAVMDGKQVAVLVPTTVLAQQHFNTFRERMADYPVRIELLSRFRTHRRQKNVIHDLISGSVDIVIGTHRLLQDDIAFKDLGLVVIDEEQRFGVLHKEKFKQLRQLVDVLTLSATPIPRTLYLALTGARDMSTIETPPQDRLPVETIVAAYDERLIRDAIQRELNRQGQVFFLHNRVTTIDTIAQRLQNLVPNARIVVGHGQLPSDELEDTMLKFVNGEADLLLSTTIIESGLDIPNANTIIIDRADRFGLSDLYQLRGRVGRYKHQAFAYFLLPRHAGLLADARKRISAIRQYSALGSGFKIAMRDLEIRGAGNLLGPEQSGHITAVGFELYCQLLKQSIGALKGEKVQPRIDVQVRLDFLALSPAEEITSQAPELEADSLLAQSKIQNRKSKISKTAAYIPFNYISESRQRIEIYRKLAQATDKNGLLQLRAELEDRFGAPPPALDLLLLVAEIKLLAAGDGISSIESKDGKLMLLRQNEYLTSDGKFPRLTRKTARGRLIEIKKFLLAL